MWPPHSFLSPRSFLPLFLLFLAFCVNGALTNTTFDDADSSFSWTTDWNAVSPSSPCHGCASKPDATQIQNQTYHDGNIGSRGGATEGSFTFQGSAVYIYGIDKDSQPNIVFTLGSTTYTHHYTGSDTDFHYHALFFSATNLASDQTHTVNWAFELNQELFAQTGKLQVGLFDYAVVTSGTADTTTPPSSPGGGGSTGSLTGGSDTSPGGNLISNVSSGSSSASSRSSSTRSTSASHTTNSGSSSSAQPTGTSNPSSSSTTNNNGDSAPPGSGSNPSNSAAAAVSQKPNVGAIVGAIVGALILGILATLCFCLWQRKRKRAARAADPQSWSWFRRGTPAVQPFFSEPRPMDSTPVAAPVSQLSEKTFDVEWNTAGQSTVSLHRNDAPNVPIPSPMSVDGQSVSAYSSASPVTARERMLEERLAELEARVGTSAPPPYVPS